MDNSEPTIKFVDTHDFGTLLISEIEKSEQLKESFKGKKPEFQVIDKIEQFSRNNIDVEATKILEDTKKAFTPVFIFNDIVYHSHIRGKDTHPAFCLIDWTVFAEEYRQSRTKAQILAVVKDFLRVAAEYFNRIAEVYEETTSTKEKELGIIIHPIIFIPRNPGLVSINDASKYLGEFIANPNITPIQVVYPKKDTDNIGLIVIKSAMAIAKLTHGVKGMRVQRSIKSAIGNFIRQISGEEEVSD